MAVSSGYLTVDGRAYAIKRAVIHADGATLEIATPRDMKLPKYGAGARAGESFTLLPEHLRAWRRRR